METNRSRRGWRGVWMLGAMIGIAGVIFWIVRPVGPRQAPAAPPQRTVPEAVRIQQAGFIDIAADSPVRKHLSELQVKSERVTFPELTVSGSILARIVSGEDPLEDRWKFSNS